MAIKTADKASAASKNQTDKTNSRKALHAYLSDEAHDEWHRFATSHGVTLSAVLESLSFELSSTAAEATMDERLEQVVTEARRVDAQRRRRRR